MEPFFKVGDKVHIISEMKECPLALTAEMHNKFGGQVFTISKVQTGFYSPSYSNEDGCCYSLAEDKETYAWSSPMFVETEEKVKKASSSPDIIKSVEIVTLEIKDTKLLYKLNSAGHFFFQCNRDGNPVGGNRDIFEYLNIDDLKYNLLKACVGKDHALCTGGWPEATETRYTLQFMSLIQDLVRLYNKSGRDIVRKECENYIKKRTDKSCEDGESYQQPTLVTPSKIELPNSPEFNFDFESSSPFVKDFYQRRKREKEVTLVLKKTRYRFK